MGHLTSATRLQPGSLYRTGGAATLSADAEVGIELGRELEPGADRDAALAAPIDVGDEVIADLGTLGRVGLAIAP